MKGYLLGLILVFLIMLSSCVPHKELVYYQDKGSASDSVSALIRQPKPYRIQINDILSIRVKALDQENVAIFNPIGDAELNMTSGERAYYDGFTVDLHGEIRIPTLGKINVLGYSTEEIENIIEERLLQEQFKETANIFVTVRLAGLRYTTSGEIIGTGTQTLFQERVNIMEAIANSGGITPFGNATDVMIIRQLPVGQGIYHVDITDVNIINSPYYYIQPNDMIYVKPRRQKSLGIGTTGLQNFSALISVVSVLTTVILIFTR